MPTANARIILKPYDDSWAGKYWQEEQLIRSVIGTMLGDPLQDIQHIGSTAIPGVRAKGTIDIVAGIACAANLDESVQLLARMGYVRLPDRETNVNRRYLGKDRNSNREFALHVIQRSDPLWSRLIQFRDELRVNPPLREAYNALKEQCANELADDVTAYTKAKDPFIRSVIEKMGPP